MKRLLVVLSISPALLVSSLALAQDETASLPKLGSAARLPAALALPARPLARGNEEARSTEKLQARPELLKPAAGRSATWEAFKGGLLGGVLGGAISAGLNYYVLPLPGSSADNAIGHGMTGFFCGLVSGFIGVLVYASRQPADSAAR